MKHFFMIIFVLICFNSTLCQIGEAVKSLLQNYKRNLDLIDNEYVFKKFKCDKYFSLKQNYDLCLSSNSHDDHSSDFKIIVDEKKYSNNAKNVKDEKNNAYKVNTSSTSTSNSDDRIESLNSSDKIYMKNCNCISLFLKAMNDISCNMNENNSNIFIFHATVDKPNYCRENSYLSLKQILLFIYNFSKECEPNKTPDINSNLWSDVIYNLYENIDVFTKLIENLKEFFEIKVAGKPHYINDIKMIYIREKCRVKFSSFFEKIEVISNIFDIIFPILTSELDYFNEIFNKLVSRNRIFINYVNYINFLCNGYDETTADSNYLYDLFINLVNCFNNKNMIESCSNSGKLLSKVLGYYYGICPNVNYFTSNFGLRNLMKYAN